MLADVNALVTAANSDIERLYRHALSVGAGLYAGQTLLLCQRILALRLPAGLAEEMSVNERVEKLVRIALAALTAGHVETEGDAGIAGVIRFVHIQFLLEQGWKFRSAQCRMASVGAADVIRWPLPRYLHFLYPLIRLPQRLWQRASRR
jgi:hypothetical protein